MLLANTALRGAAIAFDRAGRRRFQLHHARGAELRRWLGGGASSARSAHDGCFEIVSTEWKRAFSTVPLDSCITDPNFLGKLAYAT